MDTHTEIENGTATRRRLERPTDDRLVAGVASGLADYTGMPTAFVRLAALALTIFGGVGIPLYIAGWLLIPQQGESRSLAERFVARLDTTEKQIGAGLMGLAIVILVTGTVSPGLVTVALLAAVGFALTRTSTRTNKEN